MLQEDQQVCRPFFQLVYTVEVCAMVIRCLKYRDKDTNTREKGPATTRKKVVLKLCLAATLLTSFRSFSKSSSSAPMMLMAGLEHWAPNTPCYGEIKGRRRWGGDEEIKTISYTLSAILWSSRLPLWHPEPLLSRARHKARLELGHSELKYKITSCGKRENIPAPNPIPSHLMYNNDLSSIPCVWAKKCKCYR